MMIGRFRTAVWACCALCLVAKAPGQMLGPSAYLSFDDSPFKAIVSGFSYFHLEDMEDHVYNAFGSTCSSNSTGGSFGGDLVDSVDADDGLINGLSNNGAGKFGDSVWAPGSGVTITFTSGLSGLPTHVGLVWTDGGDPITFDAYDAGGVKIGTLTGNHADGSIFGGTAEDRFYGVVHLGGISKVSMRNNAGGVEIDHIQYGRLEGGTLVSGNVALRDWTGPRTTPTVDFTVRPVGGGSPIDVFGVALGAGGEFSFVVAGSGDYEVLAKASTFLRQLHPGTIALGGSPVSGLAFSLANGDVDGDNAVTVFDYNLLSDAFDSIDGDAGWNESADLDGDGSVTVFDYNILSASFDLAGD